MASYQSNTSLARTRSLRIAAKPTLTAPPTSTSPINKSPQIPTCSSNVLSFLTNLRLLDLDLAPDWPGITPPTFSAKDAAGGQKKRIQSVEWALYQLFCLWDHDDARTKLRPFYPPADQVQSINLRAALVRSLEAAKKNGVLGRDVLIRKTMLDECKGERLEEVLAVFSSAVLKKLVAERALNSGPEYRPTISETISLENWGYTGDRTELNGLLLAHKVSLRSVLVRKNAARERYRSFEELLAMKERGIARRREEAESNVRDDPLELSQTAKNELRRSLRNNWTGNEQWIDELLGSNLTQKGGLLNTSFDDVWSGVQTGGITDLEEQTVGLLEQLEQRVHRQKTRLQKWEEFRKSTFGDIRPRTARDSPLKEKKADIGFDFTAHLDLNFDKLSDSTDIGRQSTEYTNLLNRLTTELGGLKSTKLPDFSSLMGSARRGPASITPSQFIVQEPLNDTVSDLSEWEEEPEEAIPQLKAKGPATNGNSRLPAIPKGFTGFQRQLPVPRDSHKTSPVRHQDPPEVLQGDRPSKTNPPPVRNEDKPKAVEDNGLISRNGESHGPNSRPEQPSRTSRRNDISPPPLRPKSPTQALADEILSSMSNTSPSPAKKSRYTLSLAERARMSLARKAYDPEDESPQVSPVKASHSQEDGSSGTHDDLEQGEEYEDLITRTRLSMAGFDAARQKAQLERRRSQRKSKIAQRKDSYFPRVDEETVDNLSVMDGLMEDGLEDYEAIFKSRPRIATSPAPGPSRL
ncbi:HAUS augmin-like complex subunit 6 N-terminus-domain-containing protein [Xylaria palmicola]|nr:HAUS augmin-like complex subunit 6 N-terminus-domain-containing protein [Xylaria palmicola]